MEPGHFTVTNVFKGAVCALEFFATLLTCYMCADSIFDRLEHHSFILAAATGIFAWVVVGSVGVWGFAKLLSVFF